MHKNQPPIKLKSAQTKKDGLNTSLGQVIINVANTSCSSGNVILGGSHEGNGKNWGNSVGSATCRQHNVSTSSNNSYQIGTTPPRQMHQLHPPQHPPSKNIPITPISITSIPSPCIHIASLQPPTPIPQAEPTVQPFSQLTTQLTQSLHKISQLQAENAQLKQQVSFYKLKSYDIELINQELEFRREQERALQEHIEYYQQTIGRLREYVAQLEGMVSLSVRSLKKEAQSQGSIHRLENRHNKSFNVLYQSQLFDDGENSVTGPSTSRKALKINTNTNMNTNYNQAQKCTENTSFQAETSKVQTGRRSISMYDSQKQNHPITPKTRVSINLCMSSQINPHSGAIQHSSHNLSMNQKNTSQNQVHKNLAKNQIEPLSYIQPKKKVIG